MRVFTLTTTSSLIAAAIGQDAGSGLFLFPSGRPGNGQPGLLMNFNDVVISSWTSSLQDPVDLVLYGVDNTGTDFRAREFALPSQNLSTLFDLTFAVQVMNTTVPATGNYSLSFGALENIVSSWPVQAHLNLKSREAAGGFNSHGFNISSTSAPPKTLMATSVELAPTPAIITTTITSVNSMMASISTVATSSVGENPAMHTGHHFHHHNNGVTNWNGGDGGNGGNGGHGGGLSKGAIIGIVIAIVVGSFALFGPAIYLYLRRRRSRRELANRSSREFDTSASGSSLSELPKDPPRYSFEYQRSGPFGERYYRKASNASTMIVVGMAPSRRPTNASISPATPTRPTIHELHASGQMICEMPATPLPQSLGKPDKEAQRVASVQVYEMDADNARLEKGSFLGVG